jgi:hypothetical protein
VNVSLAILSVVLSGVSKEEGVGFILAHQTQRLESPPNTFSCSHHKRRTTADSSVSAAVMQTKTTIMQE